MEGGVSPTRGGRRGVGVRKLERKRRSFPCNLTFLYLTLHSLFALSALLRLLGADIVNLCRTVAKQLNTPPEKLRPLGFFLDIQVRSLTYRLV